MQTQTLQRFRIVDIEGPSTRGTLDQFHDYLFSLELDPGPPCNTVHAKALVTLFDTALFALTRGDAEVQPYLDEGRARLAHHLIRTIQSLAPRDQSAFPLRLSPTVEEVVALQNVDPSRVPVQEWHQITQPTAPALKRVFVSCGQQSDEEKTLGRLIAETAKERTGIDGYFADYEHSLDGLTRNILNAIHDASAFIAVMHRRDQLPAPAPDFRGSVWIEQELAIAAFLVQSLGLRLPARVYVQRGIRREGIRGYIILNPIDFETSDDVLSDLEGFWNQIR